MGARVFWSGSVSLGGEGERSEDRSPRIDLHIMHSHLTHTTHTHIEKVWLPRL